MFRRGLFSFLVWITCLASANAQGVFNQTVSIVVQSAATTNSQMVGAVGAHQLMDITATSQAATSMDLRLYDTAVAPTCSSATSLKGNFIIAGATAPAVGGFTTSSTTGRTFNSGIGICITGGNSNTDNTSAATGAVITFTFTRN